MSELAYVSPIQLDTEGMWGRVVEPPTAYPTVGSSNSNSDRTDDRESRGPTGLLFINRIDAVPLWTPGRTATVGGHVSTTEHGWSRDHE